MIQGQAYKFGDNINTDDIYPGKYLSITTDREEMARHCFEAVYPDFLKNAKKGNIIVAGKNFGCGSSREQAATCLKFFGIRFVIAESLARIFYRNAINLGLPVLIAPGIKGKINHGDTLTVDLQKGIVRNETTHESITVIPLPGFIMDIIKDGGLIPNLRKRLGLEVKK
ncbi:MAG TPA: 3-isopropylmalate dehydratase small subunit [bacterium]